MLCLAAAVEGPGALEVPQAAGSEAAARAPCGEHTTQEKQHR